MRESRWAATRRILRRATGRAALAGTVALVLLGWLAAFGAVLVRGDVEESGLDPESTPYAAAGRYAVGTMTRVIRGDRPIGTTVWYPASPADSHDTRVTYPYRLTMFGGVGAVSLASYPGDAYVDAPFEESGAPYPLVVLSPGFALAGSVYGWLAEHLASRGFVVISPEHDEVLDPSRLWRSTVTRPRDISAVISSAIDAGGELSALVDATSVAVIGHSYGGYAALAAGGARLDTAGFTGACDSARRRDDPVVFLCDALQPRLTEMARLSGLDAPPAGLWPDWSDARVDAVVSLAGDAVAFDRVGLAGLEVPVLAIGGTRDRDTPYSSGARLTYRHAASAKKIEIGLVGAEHFVFAGPCRSVRRVLTLVPNGFCSDPGWNRRTAHDLVKNYVTAFLLAELGADRPAAAALGPDRSDHPFVTYRAQGYPPAATRQDHRGAGT